MFSTAILDFSVQPLNSKDNHKAQFIPSLRIMHKQRSKFLISNRCLSAGRLTRSRNEDVTGVHWCTSRYFVGFLDVKCELSTSSYIFWRLTCLIVAVWSPGLNSAVEALNTLPQDILVEMVGKLIVIISAQIKVHHSSNACGIESNYVCFIFMKLW